MANQKEEFINWLNTFNYMILNEAEAESKFVLSLFAHLGYPEECRREKNILQVYKSDYYPDHVYYSVGDHTKQNRNTSLVVVEAKHPKKRSLEAALDQADFYAYKLGTPFLVAVNVSQLKVVKYRPYQDYEVLLELTLDDLKNKGHAESLYQLLNFNAVKHVKDNLFNTILHEQYVKLSNALEQYPDIQHILDEGDFPITEMTVERGKLSLAKSKVRLTCQLPIDFKEGSCQIEFSNIMLRGLKIHLSHNDILKFLMVGEGALPDWNARRFIRKLQEDTFEVRLGQTTAMLPLAEATELCFCIDTMCKEYQKILVNTEDRLQTWGFRIRRIERSYAEPVIGFHLLTVTLRLWDMMKDFSMKFCHSDGNTEWHTFQHTSPLIQIAHQDTPHAQLWPADQSVFRPTGYIEVLYKHPHLHENIFTGEREEWESKVGEKGYWTAKYAHDWTIEKFIPKVYAFYGCSQSEELGFSSNLVYDPAPLIAEISEPHQFLYYLNGIQYWLSSYTAHNLPMKLLSHYYTAFNKLVQKASNIAAQDILFLMENYRIIEYDDAITDDHKKRKEMLKKILSILAQHTRQCKHLECESRQNAEITTQIFQIMLKGDLQDVKQEEINSAKDALQSLWEQVKFQIRYTMPRANEGIV